MSGLLRTRRAAAVVLAGALALTACSEAEEAVDEAVDEASDAMDDAADAVEGQFEGSVSFAAPEDGATVTSPVDVEMAVDGVDVQPAADAVEGAGHLHIMVDTECVPAGQAIPNDDSHLHFGDGSTSTQLELEPGEHTLCLQFADNNHVATDITSTTTITVE